MRLLKLAIITITILSSCSGVRKELAKEQLIGAYKGKRTIVLQYSAVNPQVEDKIGVEEATIRIMEDKSTGAVFVKENSSFDLSSITLASNGILFSIRKQKAVESAGDFSIIEGVELFELEGNGYDGMLNTETNTLTFQYKSILEFEHEGIPVKIPAVATYDFKKL